MDSKKAYIAPEAEVTVFDCEDIITTSGPDTIMPPQPAASGFNLY